MADLSKMNAGKGGKVLYVEDANGDRVFDEVEDSRTKEKVRKYVTITLLSKDSDQFRKVSTRVTNKRLEKSLRAGGRVRVRAEEIENDQLDLLVACTTGWDNVQLGSEVLEFNDLNVRRLYQEVPAIREQVDNFIGDRANFLGN